MSSTYLALYMYRKYKPEAQASEYSVDSSEFTRLRFGLVLNISSQTTFPANDN